MKDKEPEVITILNSALWNKIIINYIYIYISVN